MMGKEIHDEDKVPDWAIAWDNLAQAIRDGAETTRKRLMKLDNLEENSGADSAANR